jgi:hypothetical protein
MIGLLRLLLVWGTGMLALRLLARSRSTGRLRDLPLAFGCGWAVLFLCWLPVQRFGPVPPAWYALVLAALGSAALVRSVPAPGPSPPPPRWLPLDRALLAILVAICATTVSAALPLPITDWDTRILWATKAKLLATEPTLTSEVFRDPYRLHIHPRYPLMLPWLGALVAGGGAGFHERGYQALLLLIGALSIAQFCMTAAEMAGRRTALVLGCAFSLTGVWMESLLHSRAEVALVFFLLLAIEAIRRWFHPAAGARVVLPALLLVGLALVKNEGLLLSAALTAGCAAAGWGGGEGTGGAVKRTATLSACWLGLYLVWVAALRGVPPVSDENYWERLHPEILAAGLNRVGALGRAVAGEVSRASHWHLVWSLPALLAVMTLARRERTSALFRMVAVVATLYPCGILFIYLLSPWRDLGQHVSITFGRVMLPLLPAFLLLLGEQVSPRSGRR